MSLSVRFQLQHAVRQANKMASKIRMRPTRSLLTSSQRAFVLGTGVTCGVVGHHANAQCETGRNQMLRTLASAAPHVNKAKMLDKIHEMDGTDLEEHVSLEDFKDIFHLGGITDDELVEELFQLMDWDETGYLRQGEVAAVLTLFQSGDENSRYKFLFQCLDLDGNDVVNKVEFRSILVALLDAKSHFHGPFRTPIPDDLFVDVEKSEYHVVSKVLANQIVRDVFLWADKTHDGDLTMKEFVQWCQRGGKNVEIVTDLLWQALSE